MAATVHAHGAHISHAHQPAKTGFYHEWLLFPKILYFVFNIVIYALHTFQNQVIEVRWGLSMKELGMAFALQVFSFIGSLYWTWFADRSGRFKIITSFGTVMYSLAFLLIFADTNLLVTRQEKLLLICSVFAVSSFFQSALFPIFDAVVMSLLSSVPGFSKDMFGRQRMWGAIGHFAATSMSDRIRSFSSLEDLKYLVGVSGLLLTMIIVFLIPSDLTLEVGKGHHHHGPKKDDAAVKVGAADEPPAQVSSPFLYLITKPAFLFFLLFMLISGMARSYMTNYQNWFVDRCFQRRSYPTFVGAVRLFSEVAVYFYNKDLSFALGPYWMLILSQLAAVVRSAGYGLVPPIKAGKYYLWCIPLELMKGLNSGLVTAGAVHIAASMAPPGGASTAQGLFSGTFIGLATFFGGILASLLIDSKLTGQAEMENIGRIFLQTAGLLLFFTVCFVVKYATIDKVILQGKSKH